MSTTTTIEELVDELNFVAESAGITYEFSVGGPNTVLFLGEAFEVDLNWAMGNATRLPDRTTSAQMVEALKVSHPDIKGLGAKHPPRNR